MHAQTGQDFSSNTQRGWVWQCKLDSPTQLRLRTNVGCCEGGNEYLGSINSGKVLGQVISSYYYLLLITDVQLQPVTPLFHFAHPRFTIVLYKPVLLLSTYGFQNT